MLAPCVICKAKLALGLSNRYRGNSKPFTPQYWERALRVVAIGRQISEKKVQQAIGEYDYYLALR
jgi:hypothetical protein